MTMRWTVVPEAEFVAIMALVGAEPEHNSHHQLQYWYSGDPDRELAVGRVIEEARGAKSFVVCAKLRPARGFKRD